MIYRQLIKEGKRKQNRPTHVGVLNFPFLGGHVRVVVIEIEMLTNALLRT